MNRPADRLLSRLDGVMRTAEGRWRARCPAHAGKSRSLAVRELPDGTVLLRCFAGCGGADVAQPAGLELRDLFPARPQDRVALKPGQRWIPREALACVRSEALLVAIAAGRLAAGKQLSDEDTDRLQLAAARLSAAAAEVRA